MKYLSLLLTLFLAFSCSKEDDNAKFLKAEVDKYVNDLVNGQLESSFELPEFELKSIDYFLTYSDKQEILEAYPVNPVLCASPPDVTLGTFVLWLIESIRLDKMGVAPYGRFPSSDPVLIKEGDDPFSSNQVENSKVAVQAYKEWWNQIENKKMDLEVDPLENVDLKWR